MAELPRIRAIYLPDIDDYGLIVYDARRDVWVLIEGRPAGDVSDARAEGGLSVRWVASPLSVDLRTVEAGKRANERESEVSRG